jgi:hypothetical protein
MGKTKQLVEDATKETPAPMIDDKPKAPDKKGGPHTADVSPNADMQAAEKTANVPERARRMAALQRKVGNAQLGRMLGSAAKDVPAVQAEAETL